MALLDRFKKKTKKEEPKEEKPVKANKVRNPIVKKLHNKSKKRLASIYNLLKEPHIAEKATVLSEKGKYVFKVALKANKIEVKKAVEDLYGVKVVSVKTIRIPSKRRRLGKSEGWKKGSKKGYKKAIVTLSKGEEIEIMPR